MTTDREQEKRAMDLETEAAHDLLRRIKALRRRVALPVFIAAGISSWAGMTAHALGYWSVLGASAGGGYFVSAYTLLFGGAICAAPIAVPGGAVYLALRARMRLAWFKEHRGKEVDEEWLARNARRFG